MPFKLFDRIQETATTTGTGDFALAGAVTGFKTFASRYSVGDSLYYAIQSVSASGIPSGDWEVGIGTYSAAATLSRTTVLASSNSDALVNFGAGDKRVGVTMTALQGASIREKLAGDRTYYVRTDGSDSNNGRANTSGGAFLTIQAAVDVVADTLDLNNKTVTIQVGDGTYTGAVSIRRFVGRGTLVIQGNSGTPANVVISTTSASAFSIAQGAVVTVKDMKIQTTTSGYAFVVTSYAVLTFTNINFGALAGGGFYQEASTVSATGNYTISGGAPYHVYATGGARFVCTSRTVTISGTPAFSSAFAAGISGAVIEVASNTYSGSATGKRYDVALNAICNTGGGGATYLPGNSAGTTATGGQYI